MEYKTKKRSEEKKIRNRVSKNKFKRIAVIIIIQTKDGGKVNSDQHRYVS